MLYQDSLSFIRLPAAQAAVFIVFTVRRGLLSQAPHSSGHSAGFAFFTRPLIRATVCLLLVMNKNAHVAHFCFPLGSVYFPCQFDFLIKSFFWGLYSSDQDHSGGTVFPSACPSKWTEASSPTHKTCMCCSIKAQYIFFVGYQLLSYATHQSLGLDPLVGPDP